MPRRQVEANGTMNIPPKANRRWKNCFWPVLYRNRNAIEGMFGRLKDYRGIQPATIDEQPTSSLPVYIAAASAIGYEFRP
jgi:transposase